MPPSPHPRLTAQDEGPGTLGGMERYGARDHGGGRGAALDGLSLRHSGEGWAGVPSKLSLWTEGPPRSRARSRWNFRSRDPGKWSLPVGWVSHLGEPWTEEEAARRARGRAAGGAAGVSLKPPGGEENDRPAPGGWGSAEASPSLPARPLGGDMEAGAPPPGALGADVLSPRPGSPEAFGEGDAAGRGGSELSRPGDPPRGAGDRAGRSEARALQGGSGPGPRLAYRLSGSCSGPAGCRRPRTPGEAPQRKPWGRRAGGARAPATQAARGGGRRRPRRAPPSAAPHPAPDAAGPGGKRGAAALRVAELPGPRPRFPSALHTHAGSGCR